MAYMGWRQQENQYPENSEMRITRDSTELKRDARTRGVQRGGAPLWESEGVPQMYFFFLPHLEGSHTSHHNVLDH